VGDFGYVEAMTQRKYQGKSIPVRVYTTRGLEDQARFALECAHRTVDYFSEIFEIEYPLPKADLLAVHEFVRDKPLLGYVLVCSRLIFSFCLGYGSHGELGSGNLSNDSRSL